MVDKGVDVARIVGLACGKWFAFMMAVCVGCVLAQGFLAARPPKALVDNCPCKAKALARSAAVGPVVPVADPAFAKVAAVPLEKGGEKVAEKASEVKVAEPVSEAASGDVVPARGK